MARQSFRFHNSIVINTNNKYRNCKVSTGDRKPGHSPPCAQTTWHAAWNLTRVEPPVKHLPNRQ